MDDSGGGNSRREFLKGAGVVLGGSWLGLQSGELIAAARAAQARHVDDEPLDHIDPDSARRLAAVADQVWPPDDTAGGADLGAVHFMDFAFGGFMAGAWPMVREGLGELDEYARKETGSAFDELPFDVQTRLLQAREDRPFFGLVHFLTCVGCFALPEYGGNKNHEGWAQLGFDQRHYWQPPFGHYDKGHHGEDSVAAAQVAGSSGDAAGGHGHGND